MARDVVTVSVSDVAELLQLLRAAEKRASIAEAKLSAMRAKPRALRNTKSRPARCGS